MLRQYLSIFIFILLISCSKPDGIQVPDQLGTLILNQKVTGKEADLIITRLHIGKFQPGENIVAYYEGKNKKATLYISTHASREEADTLLRRMADKIGKGNYGFWHHVQFKLDDQPVHLTMGQGQLHYFFTKGNQVIWLASPIDEGNAMLGQLLNISEKRIKDAIQNAIQSGGKEK